MQPPLQKSVSSELRQQMWQWLHGFNQSANFDLAQWSQQKYAEDIDWNGCEPINQVCGQSAVCEAVWQPFLHAFPTVSRRDDIFVAGEYEGDIWFAATGRYLARFERDWLGIPANGELVQIRYGEFYCQRNGRIVASYHLFDLPYLMEQAGVNVLPASLGKNQLYLSPQYQDGLKLEPGDEVQGQKSIQLVEDMLQGLLAFDGHDLSSMPIGPFWQDNFLWYGPGGIGTTCGLKDFRRGHQASFLQAFPDRYIVPHQSYFADDNYATVAGWPSLKATHKGGGWLGLAPTGKQVEMRVMDWWCRRGDKLAENWVHMDLPHILKQLGYDVFARLRQLTAAKPQNTQRG